MCIIGVCLVPLSVSTHRFFNYHCDELCFPCQSWFEHADIWLIISLLHKLISNLLPLQAVVFYTKQPAGLPKEIQGTVWFGEFLLNIFVFFVEIFKVLIKATVNTSHWFIDLIIQSLVEIAEVERGMYRLVHPWGGGWCVLCNLKWNFSENLFCRWQDSLTVVVEDLRLCSVKPCEDNERRFCFEVVSPTK